MQCKRNRFSLDRKVEILKFHRDILLETSPVIIDFHHYVASLAYATTTKRSYFESMIPYESTDPDCNDVHAENTAK